MRNECEAWTADPELVESLALFAGGRFAELQAIVTIGYYDEVEPWLIGKAAWLAWGQKKGSGFSPGTTTDELQRRKNFASGASKAVHKWNLDPLKNQLERLRKDGGKPQSVSWQQMLDRCDHLIIHGSASESLRAIELKTKLTGKGDSITKEQTVRALIARLGPERARRGLEELGFGLLISATPDLFEDDTENDDEQSRPATRRAGDDLGNLDSGGLRRISDDAARKMDRGLKNAGGTGTSQRAASSRDIDGRVNELEEARA